MAWLRYDAESYADARVIRAGFAGAMVWPLVLARVKTHGVMGVIGVEDLEPDVLARVTGAATDQERALLADGVVALVKAGLLVRVQSDAGDARDGRDVTGVTARNVTNGTASRFVVPGWDRYQDDPTNAERQRAFRNRRLVREAANATAVASEGSENVTERNVTNGSSPLLTGSNGCNGYGTGRDVTLEQPPYPPATVTASPPTSAPPPVNGGGGVSEEARALTDEDRAVLLAVCTALERTGAAKDATRAEEKRKLLAAADAPGEGTIALVRQVIRENRQALLRFPDEIAKVRRSFAMERNGRKSGGAK